MKVELEKLVWLTDGEGDPPRTIVEANATEYESMSDALTALTKARRYRPFDKAEIVEDAF